MSFADLVEGADRAAQDLLGGTAITYAPAVGAPVPVTGMFDENYVLAKGGTEAGAEVLGPAVFVRLEDLPVDPRTDNPTITIGAKNYRVTERRPDGVGGMVLVLRQK